MLQTIVQVIGPFLCFFATGFFLANKRDFLERLSLSFIVGMLVSVFLIQYSNILGIPINNYFFLLTLFPLVAIILKNRNDLGVSEWFGGFRKREHQYLLAIVLFSIVLKLLFFARANWMPIGTDVVRWGTVTHSWFLKGQITPDLQPYFSSGNYFSYTPLTLILGLVAETLFFDPITGATLISCLLSTMSVITFYMLCREFLGEKKALYSSLYYVALFDSSFIYIINRFLYSFASGFFPLFLSMYYLTRAFKDGKADRFLVPVLVFLATSHFFHLFPLLIFLICLYIVRRDREVLLDILKKSLLAVVMAVLVFLPYLIVFMGNIGHTNQPYVSAEWTMYETFSELANASPLERLLVYILANGMEPYYGFFYGFGLVLMFLAVKRFSKSRKTLSYFFMICLITSFFYTTNVMFIRFSTFPKMLYPLATSIFFSDPSSAIILTGMSFFVERTPAWYAMNDFNNTYLDIVTSEEIDAYEFIRQNVPEEATFLIDGGGQGIFEGHSGSHGDRIFVLTSRRVFYYSGIMELGEYQKRLDVYRRISINPDNLAAIQELKDYGVTHVYVGPADVGLNENLFIKSENYELLWREGDVYIFEIA
jgi:hypothetical protein